MSTDKKEHIMEAAINLFAEKGFEGTSIRDLAAKADVNVAMVNYYFGSKEKLFEAIIEHKAGYMRNNLTEMEKDDSISEIEKIDQLIESYVNRILSQPGFHRILYQELMVSQRKDMHTPITNLFGYNSNKIKQIIEKGIRKKEFKKVDPALTVATLIGSINQVVLSKAMCCMLLHEDASFNPYTNPAFKQRLINHIKQLMHSHLLIEKN